MKNRRKSPWGVARPLPVECKLKLGELLAFHGGLDEFTFDPYRTSAFLLPEEIPDYESLSPEDYLLLKEEVEAAVRKGIIDPEALEELSVSQIIALYQELVERKLKLLEPEEEEEEIGEVKPEEVETGKEVENEEFDYLLPWASYNLTLCSCGRQLGKRILFKEKLIPDGFLWVSSGESGRKKVFLGCRGCAEKVISKKWRVWRAFNDEGLPLEDSWWAALEFAAALQAKTRKTSPRNKVVTAWAEGGEIRMLCY